MADEHFGRKRLVSPRQRLLRYRDAPELSGQVMAALKHARGPLDLGKPAACGHPEGIGSYYFSITSDLGEEVCRPCLVAFIAVVIRNPQRLVRRTITGGTRSCAEAARCLLASGDLDPFDPLTVVLRRSLERV